MSTYLLWITAAVSLISGILTLTMVGRLAEVYSDLYEGTAAAGTESLIVGASVFGVVVNLLFAAGLVILSIFNNRGRNGARITTWVIGGLMLCCTGGGLASTGLTSSMNIDSGAGPSQQEIESRLDQVLPSWYNALSIVLTVVSLLAILGAVILLALPASNAFFRKPAAGGLSGPPAQPPSYPPQQQPPAAPPTSDPWGRPGGGDQKPPPDPTAQP
jgi:hypothetical protein